MEENQQLQTIDVRTIAPRERHPVIFATFDALQPGEAFILINDHDPKPLWYQLSAERSGAFTWDYLEQGPEVWRARISTPDVSRIPQMPTLSEPPTDRAAPIIPIASHLSYAASDGRGQALNVAVEGRHHRHLLLLGLALAMLLSGLWGGPLRAGWSWPVLLRPLPMTYGPLMIAGFLGTLISLEWAVATWWHAAVCDVRAAC